MFLQGLGITLLYSAIAVMGGTILGALFSLLRGSGKKIFRWPAIAYIEVVRGTPLLVQLYFFMFLIPMWFTTVQMGKELAVALTLVLNSAAYVAEIIRSGIQAVDRGQIEAARSLGMSTPQTMRKIVLPQAIRNILPALANEFIMVVKESSLASTFFVGDLMTQANLITSTTFNPLAPILIVAFIYFIVTFTLSKGVAVLERKLSQGD